MLRREAIGALVVVLGVVVAALLWWPGGTSTSSRRSASPAASPGRTTTSAPAGPRHHVLAVKIDNVATARPQTGVGAADIVYVEQVEGGLTRIAAVYCTAPPPAVGPVRSARFSDLQLLAQYGRPTLAYSGAAPELLPRLHAAPLVSAAQAEVPGAYYRDGSRPVPHNLYVHPARLPAGGTGTCPALRGSPAAPAGGTATGHAAASYPSAHYDFTWSPRAGRWLVSMDGTPFTDAVSGRVSAHAVVLEHVPAGGGPSIPDAAGNAAPNVTTVGHGSATVLLDGRSYTATWSRPSPSAHTTYRTSGGTPLALGPGPIWVLLLPS